MPELRQYRYFVEIARRGSFTAASRAVHITQSALSEQIKQLEIELGCRLFDRGRQGVQLTSAGETLVVQVEQLLRLSGEIDRSMAQAHEPRREPLRLGVTIGPLLFWLPDVVAVLDRERRDVEVVVEDINTAEIFLRLSTGALDLGIVSLSPTTLAGISQSGLEVVQLYADDFVILTPHDHELAGDDPVPLSALRNQRMIGFPRTSSLRLVTDELLAAEGVRPRVVIDTGFLEMAIRFVELGLGVCVAPRAATLTPTASTIAIMEIEAAEPPARILAALFRTDTPRREVIDQLLELATERIAPLFTPAGWNALR